MWRSQGIVHHSSIGLLKRRILARKTLSSFLSTIRSATHENITMTDSNQLTSHHIAGYKVSRRIIRKIQHSRGDLQAAMKNPNVSEEAKQHAEQIVDEVDGGSETYQSRHVHYDDGKEENRVTGGYKATLSST